MGREIVKTTGSTHDEDERGFGYTKLCFLRDFRMVVLIEHQNFFLCTNMRREKDDET